MQSEQPKNGYGMTLSACLWLGLFPLLQRGTYSHFTHDKWVFMLILSGITLLCFGFDFILKRRVSIPRFTLRSYLPFLLAAALTLWTVLSCLLSSDGPETWWLGKSARYEGLVSRLCYFLVFACFFFSRVSLKPVLLSAAAGVCVFFVIILLQRAGGNPLGLYPTGYSYEKITEFQGTIGNIDMGTGYLLLLSGFFLYGLVRILRERKAGRKSVYAGITAVSALIGLVLSLWLIFTMDVQFGFVALAVLLIFTLLRLLPKKARLPALLFLIVLALLVVWFWPGQNGGLYELHEIFHGNLQLSFGGNRIAVWSYSLRLAKENLLFGGGSGTYPSRFNQFLKDNSLKIPTQQNGMALPHYFDNPHDEYIQQLTDHGLPALLLFMALLLASVFRRQEGWFPLLAPCSAAVLCYAVQAVFSFSVCIVAPMFWMLLGLSFRE